MPQLLSLRQGGRIIVIHTGLIVLLVLHQALLIRFYSLSDARAKLLDQTTSSPPRDQEIDAEKNPGNTDNDEGCLYLLICTE